MGNNEISIGRSKLNDLVVKDQEVSSFHCKLVFKKDGSLWIYDLDSTNGVYLNGVRVQDRARLMPDDKIKLGSYGFDWQSAVLISPSEKYTEQNPTGALTKSDSQIIHIKWVLIASFVIAIPILLFTTGIYEKSKEKITEVTNSWKLKNKEITYDISCLVDESSGGKFIKSFGDAKKDVLELNKLEINIKEEEEVGLEVKRQIDEEYIYSQDPKYITRIEKIFSRLVSKMENPKFEYKYQVVESDEINSFTAGGHIFIFTGLIDFAINDDEIACILGHEIYHNELSHISDKLKEIKIARNWLGEEFGDLAYYTSSLLSSSFNQENEVYSDLYGLDLAVKAGYNGCAGIDFWERMHSKDNQKTRTLFDKFLRSHPYSDERVSCNRKHIDFNYYHKCN